MRLARSWTSISSSTTSELETTVRLERLVTISVPLRSRMRPRGASVVMVRVRLLSASAAYSSDETSCMLQRRAMRTAKMPATPTARPTRRFPTVFSPEVSEPPAARGDAPPMSKVKLASPRPKTTKTTMSATATTALTMIMMSFTSMASPRGLACRGGCRATSDRDRPRGSAPTAGRG